MRKTIYLLVLALIVSALLSSPISIYADVADDWDAEPIITKVYESGKEQIIVEWEGTADFYYVYLDGERRRP